jgi:RNA polymerase sigma-70 factor (ECF subfamily)
MENTTLVRSKATLAIQDEAALVEEAWHDTEAFAMLYRHYLPQLYRYLMCRLNNIHDAEDLTMQVFIAALEGLVAYRYREGGCFAA